jgi:hypothetical protein
VPGATTIRLQFGADVTPSVRARMDYAFRVYAAIYGHRVLSTNSNEKVRTIFYGGPVANSWDQKESLHIPALYQPAAAARTRKVTRHPYAREEIILFHGLDPQTLRPDWLGEIFEWLSSGHEKGILNRDSVGRIPDAEMIFERQGIPAWKPHASLLMAWLENCLHGGESEPALPKAPSPVSGVDHLVVCSHDIDFYFTSRFNTLHRLIKNLAIAVLHYRSRNYFSANCAMIKGLLKGERIGDYLPTLISRLTGYDVTSTLFVVPRKAHRRDPNYFLQDISEPLKEAAKHGFPVEIHGSYESSLDARTLLPEAAELHKILQNPPTGNRQHWLRFGNTADLFRIVEEAGLQFDSSVGFTDLVGFRSGASFAFPPYNLKEERAYDFLEIPLAIMDGSLVEQSCATNESPQFLADRILAESRNRGWGGISILWHNPVEALAVPEAVNQVFWNCAANKQSFREKWISTDAFFSLCLRRYQDAGLLTKIQIPASAGKEVVAVGAAYSDKNSAVVPQQRYAAEPIS